MARVVLTSHLRRFFPGLPAEVDLDAGTVAEVVRTLEARWPGLGFYLEDEQGRLRTHVACFVDGVRVPGEASLGTSLTPTSIVEIVQALSGG